MWLGFLFVLFFLWYFLESFLNNFIVFLIIFILIQLKLFYFWILNILEISDIINQGWIFPYFQNLIKSSILIFNGDSFFFSIINDHTTFTIFYKMFLHQQWLLYILTLIFLNQKVRHNFTNSNDIHISNFFLHLYVYGKYLFYNVVSLTKYVIFTTIVFFKINIIKFNFFTNYFVNFNKSIILWKPLFKRWSYIGFYFKTKMFWLNKNRQR